MPIHSNGIPGRDSQAHPLDPLTVAEIKRVVALVRQLEAVTESARFADVELLEPPKEVVAGFGSGAPFERQVLVRMVTSPKLSVLESVVSVSQDRVVSSEFI